MGLGMDKTRGSIPTLTGSELMHVLINVLAGVFAFDGSVF